MDPLDDEARAALRRAVFALRCRERRRVFPTTVQVGDPDAGHASYAVGSELLDSGLRADIVAALIRGVPEGEVPAFWLTRSGVPEPHDDDRVWTAAARQAFGEAGQPVRWFAVVTRTGWYDVTHGEARTWKRLRIRR